MIEESFTGGEGPKLMAITRLDQSEIWVMRLLDATPNNGQPWGANR